MTLIQCQNIGLYTDFQEKIGDTSLVVHLRCELPRFAKIYLEYSGTLTATVQRIKLSRSLLPQGGLEISIALTVRKNKAQIYSYSKMKENISECYMEPENLPTEIKEKDSDNHDPLRLQL